MYIYFYILMNIQLEGGIQKVISIKHGLTFDFMLQFIVKFL